MDMIMQVIDMIQEFIQQLDCDFERMSNRQRRRRARVAGRKAVREVAEKNNLSNRKARELHRDTQEEISETSDDAILNACRKCCHGGVGMSLEEAIEEVDG